MTDGTTLDLNLVPRASGVFLSSRDSGPGGGVRGVAGAWSRTSVSPKRLAAVGSRSPALLFAG